MASNKKVLLATLGVVIATFILLYFMGNLLLAFGLSAVFAYLLLPVVKLLDRIMPWRERKPGLTRTLSVLLVFLAILGILVGVLFLIVPPTVQQTSRFVQDFPEFFQRARVTLEGWVDTYSERIPVRIRMQIESAAADAGNIIFGAVRNLLVRTIGVISTSFSLIVAFAIAPMLVFYLLKDSATIQEGLTRPFPSAMRPHVAKVLEIAHHTVGAYMRGQLILGLVVGTIVAIGLLILGIPFAFLLGIVAGITEMIPIIGPWIGGVVGVLVTLASAPEQVLWVILLYIGVQLLENTLLVPRIQGQSLNLHPVIVLLVITVASQIWGVWGVILAAPVAALIKDLTVYFVEQWNQTNQPAITGLLVPSSPAKEPESSDPEPADEEAES